MPYFDFIWTDEIVDHISQHGISQQDFEDVVSNPEIQGNSHTSPRLAAWGHTVDGRFIIAIYEFVDKVTVLPVTAFEVDEF